MANSDVLIRKFIFDLEIDKQESFSFYNESLSNFVKERSEEIFQDIFNKVGINENIFIDSLEINLENLDIDNLDFLEQRIYETVVDQILKIQSKTLQTRFQNIKQFNLQSLFQFIANYGFLPWSFNNKKKVNYFFKQEIRKEAEKKNLSKILVDNLKGFKRVLTILSFSNNIQLRKILFGENFKFHQNIIDLERKIVHQLSKTPSLKHEEFNETTFFTLKLLKKSSLSSISILSELISFFKVKYQLSDVHIISLKEEISDILKIKNLNYREDSILEEKYKEYIFTNKDYKTFLNFFLELEKKQILKATVTTDLELSTISKIKKKEKLEFSVFFDEILKFYEQKHKYKSEKIVKSVIDYFLKKRPLKTDEKLFLNLVYERVFEEDKYKSSRREEIFYSIGYSLRIDFRKIYEKIVNLLSYQNRLQYKDFIIFSMLKAYRLNTDRSDEVLIFESVVRSLKKIDSKIIPIDLNNLQKRDFSNLFFSNQIDFRKVYEKFLSLLPYQKRLQHKDFIKLAILKIYRSDSKRKDEILIFEEVVKLLNKVDPKIVPSDFKNLKSRDVSDLFFLNDKSDLKELGTSKKNLHRYKNKYQDDENYFEFSLNLNNEIYKEKFLSESKKNRIYNSLDEILKDIKSLREFLTNYEYNEELLINFSRISLNNNINVRFTKLLKRKFKYWINFEMELIDIQKENRFSDLLLDDFKLFIRLYLLKLISANERSLDLTSGSFTLNFLNFINKKSNIYLDEIRKLFLYKSEGLSDEIFKGIKVFIDLNPYQNLPNKEKKLIYFRDLYYYFLKTNKLPFWSGDQQIDDQEITSFISHLVKRKEKKYLFLIFSDNDIIQNISRIIVSQSNKFYADILDILYESKKTWISSDFFFKLIKSYEKINIDSKSTFQEIILQKIWMISSPTYLRERLISLFTIKSNYYKKKIEKEISSFFKKDVENLKSDDYQSILNYLIDSKKMPSILQDREKKLDEKLMKFLLSDPTKIGPYLNLNYYNLPDLINKYDKIFTVEILKEAIFFHFKQQSAVHQALKVYFDIIDELSLKTIIGHQSIIIIFNFFIIGQKEIKFVLYYLLDLLKSTTSVEVDKIRMHLLKSRAIIDLVESKSIFLSKRFDHFNTDWERLSYYIEFGSNKIDNYLYSPMDYKSILKKSSPLLIRKNLYQWSKKDNQIERFIFLFPLKNQTKMVLSYIHPQLYKLLYELNILIDKLNLKDNFVAPQRGEFFPLNKILKIWAKSNLNLDSPYKLLSKILKEYLKETGIKFDQFKSMVEAKKIDIKIDINQLYRFFKKTKPTKRMDFMDERDFERIKTDELNEGISIENAGLVIAWPFLNILFSKLGLIENSQLKDDESKQKALLATQYLVDGKLKTEENKLVLNKILCGLEIDFYLDESLELNDIETGVCDMALKTILEQWGKVKSVSTLRDYFLKRKGVLKSDEGGGYKLIVEKESRDILLRFLPWNLAIIKSSFMNSKLVIDWKYQ